MNKKTFTIEQESDIENLLKKEVPLTVPVPVEKLAKILETLPEVPEKYAPKKPVPSYFFIGHYWKIGVPVAAMLFVIGGFLLGKTPAAPLVPEPIDDIDAIISTFGSESLSEKAFLEEESAAWNMYNDNQTKK